MEASQTQRRDMKTPFIWVWKHLQALGFFFVNRVLGGGVCEFLIGDFVPGATPPTVEQRSAAAADQGVAHACGSPACPMMLSTEVPFANATQNAEDATQRGWDTETIRLVDERAFPGTLNVLVKLSELGIDGTLWGDLRKFSGVVTSRYYHPVTNLPMYTVDFGGGIGQRIVRVCDTELDKGKQFETNPGGSLECDGVGGSCADGNQHQHREIRRGDSDEDDP
ncbi:hypothetical protein M758_7G096300 [Ceratodon purpureus]|nr:hypothetical protein M758_7G096300 [Ceratodon purpureus]